MHNFPQLQRNSGYQEVVVAECLPWWGSPLPPAVALAGTPLVPAPAPPPRGSAAAASAALGDAYFAVQSLCALPAAPIQLPPPPPPTGLPPSAWNEHIGKRCSSVTSSKGPSRGQQKQQPTHALPSPCPSAFSLVQLVSTPPCSPPPPPLPPNVVLLGEVAAPHPLHPYHLLPPFAASPAPAAFLVVDSSLVGDVPIHRSSFYSQSYSPRSQYGTINTSVVHPWPHPRASSLTAPSLFYTQCQSALHFQATFPQLSAQRQRTCIVSTNQQPSCGPVQLSGFSSLHNTQVLQPSQIGQYPIQNPAQCPSYIHCDRRRFNSLNCSATPSESNLVEIARHSGNHTESAFSRNQFHPKTNFLPLTRHPRAVKTHTSINSTSTPIAGRTIPSINFNTTTTDQSEKSQSSLQGSRKSLEKKLVPSRSACQGDIVTSTEEDFRLPYQTCSSQDEDFLDESEIQSATRRKTSESSLDYPSDIERMVNRLVNNSTSTSQEESTDREKSGRNPSENRAVPAMARSQRFVRSARGGSRGGSRDVRSLGSITGDEDGDVDWTTYRDSFQQQLRDIFKALESHNNPTLELQQLSRRVLPHRPEDSGDQEDPAVVPEPPMLDARSAADFRRRLREGLKKLVDELPQRRARAPELKAVGYFVKALTRWDETTPPGTGGLRAYDCEHIIRTLGETFRWMQNPIAERSGINVGKRERNWRKAASRSVHLMMMYSLLSLPGGRFRNNQTQTPETFPGDPVVPPFVNDLEADAEDKAAESQSQYSEDDDAPLLSRPPLRAPAPEASALPQMFPPPRPAPPQRRRGTGRPSRKRVAVRAVQDRVGNPSVGLPNSRVNLRRGGRGVAAPQTMPPPPPAVASTSNAAPECHEAGSQCPCTTPPPERRVPLRNKRVLQRTQQELPTASGSPAKSHLQTYARFKKTYIQKGTYPTPLRPRASRSSFPARQQQDKGTFPPQQRLSGVWEPPDIPSAASTPISMREEDTGSELDVREFRFFEEEKETTLEAVGLRRSGGRQLGVFSETLHEMTGRAPQVEPRFLDSGRVDPIHEVPRQEANTPYFRFQRDRRENQSRNCAYIPGTNFLPSRNLRSRTTRGNQLRHQANLRNIENHAAARAVGAIESINSTVPYVQNLPGYTQYIPSSRFDDGFNTLHNNVNQYGGNFGRENDRDDISGENRFPQNRAGISRLFNPRPLYVESCTIQGENGSGFENQGSGHLVQRYRVIQGSQTQDEIDRNSQQTNTIVPHFSSPNYRVPATDVRDTLFTRRETGNSNRQRVLGALDTTELSPIVNSRNFETITRESSSLGFHHKNPGAVNRETELFSNNEQGGLNRGRTLTMQSSSSYHPVISSVSNDQFEPGLPYSVQIRQQSSLEGHSLHRGDQETSNLRQQRIFSSNKQQPCEEQPSSFLRHNSIPLSEINDNIMRPLVNRQENTLSTSQKKGNENSAEDDSCVRNSNKESHFLTSDHQYSVDSFLDNSSGTFQEGEDDETRNKQKYKQKSTSGANSHEDQIPAARGVQQLENRKVFVEEAIYPVNQVQRNRHQTGNNINSNDVQFICEINNGNKLPQIIPKVEKDSSENKDTEATGSLKETLNSYKGGTGQKEQTNQCQDAVDERIRKSPSGKRTHETDKSNDIPEVGMEVEIEYFQPIQNVARVSNEDATVTDYEEPIPASSPRSQATGIKSLQNGHLSTLAAKNPDKQHKSSTKRPNDQEIASTSEKVSVAVCPTLPWPSNNKEYLRMVRCLMAIWEVTTARDHLFTKMNQVAPDSEANLLDVSHHLRTGQYTSVHEFVHDVRHVLSSTYNNPAMRDTPSPGTLDSARIKFDCCVMQQFPNSDFTSAENSNRRVRRFYENIGEKLLFRHEFLERICETLSIPTPSIGLRRRGGRWRVSSSPRWRGRMSRMSRKI